MGSGRSSWSKSLNGYQLGSSAETTVVVTPPMNPLPCATGTWIRKGAPCA
jgi:hypothetical protein